MTQYKLTYFDSRGLGEPIRFILAAAKVPYEDIRLPLDLAKGGLPEDFKATLPWGQIPVLEWDGHILAQSLAICKFLARKYNLEGENEFSWAKGDEIVNGMRDFQMGYFRPWFMAFGDDAKQKEAINLIKNEGLPACFSRLEEILEKNNGKWLLGGKDLTWVDLWVSTGIEQLAKVLEFNPVEDYPKLGILYKEVYQDERIRKWLDKRPDTKY